MEWLRADCSGADGSVADYIVHMGEPGRALYFITKGMCSVIIEKQIAQAVSGTQFMLSHVGPANGRPAAPPRSRRPLDPS